MSRSNQVAQNTKTSMLGNSTGGPHFIASTVVSERSSLPSSIIRRDRLTNLLNQRGWSRRNMVIGGPAGSGKTILALQSAMEQFDTFQYISARGTPDHAYLDLAPAHPYATTLAEIANLLVGPPDSSKMGILEQMTAQYLKQLEGSSATIVFDDADLIADHIDGAGIAIATKIVTHQGDSCVIWISRYGREPLPKLESEYDSVHELSGSLLGILDTDVPALTAAGVFGHASSSDINAAVASMSGWFTGVEMLLDPDHAGFSDLDTYIFNQLIWPQLLPVQHVIATISQLPYFTHDLVCHLLRTVDVGKHIAHRILTSFPLIGVEPRKMPTATYRFPEPVVASIARVSNHIGKLSGAAALRERSVMWFLSIEDIEAAKLAAIAFGLAPVYIQGVKPLCATLAAAAQWSQVRDILNGVPKGLVYQDCNLAFWYMKGCSYVGDWEAVADIRNAVFSRWMESDDPLEHGRALLIEAWRNWTQSKTKATLASATQSYKVLPAEAQQDRLWAAIQAENAARNRGRTDLIEAWAPRSGGFGTYMTVSPEFWHINCGFHRLNHLAMTGKLQHAYQLASGALIQAPVAFPQTRFRYLLLQAYIDIERSNLDAARALLDQAERYALTPPITAQLEIASATYLLRRGDFDAAESRLRLKEDGNSSRPDYYWHRVRLLAEIQLAAGETALAQDVITNWCRGEDAWPKYFGEPHHHLLSAKILMATGALEEANENAQYVINEALDRQHSFYMIQAYAIQAEYQKRRDRPDLQADRIRAAVDSDDTEGAVLSLSPFGVDLRSSIELEIFSRDTALDQQPSRAVAYLAQLSPREIQILRAAASGMANKDISETYFISLSTVKNHLAAIYKKLGVNNRRDAIELVFPLQRTESETKR